MFSSRLRVQQNLFINDSLLVAKHSVLRVRRKEIESALNVGGEVYKYIKIYYRERGGKGGGGGGGGQSELRKLI